MRFDLIVANGLVIDPASGLHDVRDVGISGATVAAIDRAIPPEAAARVIDARGLIVSPGFVDLHAHIFRGVGYWSIDPEPLAPPSGVTTWVDAGTAGAYTYPAFDRMAREISTLTIRSFLNISYLGLVGLNYDELANPDACDVSVARRVVERYRDRIVGVKVRMGSARVAGGDLEPLRRARQLADECGIPLMVHVGAEPPRLEEVLPSLKSGDVLTHCWTGATMRLVGERGDLRRGVADARERGVLFDIGHGTGSFSFESGERLAARSFWPDTISTDIHAISYHGPNVVDQRAIHPVVEVRGDGRPGLDLPLVMGKLLHVGMPLERVLTAVTAIPARVAQLSDRAGSLAVGMPADVAVFALDETPATLFDVHGARREAAVRIRVAHTIRGGVELPQRPAPIAPPWIELVEDERRPGSGGQSQ